MVVHQKFGNAKGLGPKITTIIYCTISDTAGNAQKIELLIEAPTGDDNTIYTQCVSCPTTSPFRRQRLDTVPKTGCTILLQLWGTR
jgi:hypothetical protein